MNKIQLILFGIAAGTCAWLGGAGNATAAPCPGWGCGANAATVGDGIVFDELNVNGQAGPSGMQLINPRLANHAPVTLRVTGHKLTAIDTANPAMTYVGPQLEGMTFAVRHNDGRAYEIKVAKVHERCEKKVPSDRCLQFWVLPNDAVPYYDFLVRKIHRRTGAAPGSANRRGDDRPIESGPGEKLCKGEFLEQGPLWTGIQNSAIVFEGDHYDVPRKRVTPPAGNGWFNLACAGGVMAKMHLLRHTKAGSVTLSGPPRQTTLGQRTAMLKMLTADYCGDGTAWTADGTPLQYMVKGWYPTQALNLDALAQAGQIEAVWEPNGPLCLNAPRRRPTVPAVAGCTPPGVTRAEVQARCPARFATPTNAGVTAPDSVIARCNAAWWAAHKNDSGLHVVSAYSLTPGQYCDSPPVTAGPN